MQTRHSPSLTTLHSLARSAAIPDYEKLPKSILFKKLQESFDIERLQRVEARSKRIQELSNKKRPLDQDDGQTTQIEFKRRPPSSSSSSSSSAVMQVLNKLDPIMLNPIAKKNTWKYIRPNGSAVMFNVDTLVDYILTTGDFTDPETRIPFTDKDLQEVDDLVIKGKLKKSSVLEAKRNPQMFSDFKFRRDALQGLERCAGEVITDILTIIETCDPDEAQMRLIMRELPTFADYYRQLRDADLFFAKQCMRHWTQFLEGPPNRPNEDTYGLIEVVIHFLNMCDSVMQSITSSTSSASSSSNANSSSNNSSSTATTTANANVSHNQHHNNNANSYNSSSSNNSISSNNSSNSSSSTTANAVTTAPTVVTASSGTTAPTANTNTTTLTATSTFSPSSFSSSSSSSSTTATTTTTTAASTTTAAPSAATTTATTNSRYTTRRSRQQQQSSV